MPDKKDKKRNVRSRREFSLKGRPISSGVAVARVCLFNDTVNREPAFYKINIDDIDNEKKRIAEAFEKAIEKTENMREKTLREVGEAESGIFNAHRTILQDRSVRRKINSAVEDKHLNAEAAVSEVFDDYEKRIAQINDEYLSQRSSDIADIKSIVLSQLGETSPSFTCENQNYCVSGQNRVIVAEELTPHLTMDMNTARVAAFVTEKGGSTSHAAILARSLGIPAVSGLKGIHSFLQCGVEVVVDGNEGIIIVNPSEDEVTRIREQKRKDLREIEKVSPVEEVVVMANVNTSSEVSDALSMEAEGVGLYRTEFEFIRAGKLLSEEKQYQHYLRAVREIEGKPVYFRLLDLGSDKPPPGIKLIREENPALGLRGARLLEANWELLQKQARAIARASIEGDVWVMLPMVVDSRQFVNIKEKFFDSVKNINKGPMKFGAMFEVPAACLEADSILKEADFASIGSNDLIQYLFAVDRNNDSVSYDYDPDRKVFWDLLEKIASAGRRYNRPVSICGEMAADPELLQKILKSGIRTVSVSPRFIPEVRKAASLQLSSEI